MNQPLGPGPHSLWAQVCQLDTESMHQIRVIILPLSNIMNNCFCRSCTIQDFSLSSSVTTSPIWSRCNNGTVRKPTVIELWTKFRDQPRPSRPSRKCPNHAPGMAENNSTPDCEYSTFRFSHTLQIDRDHEYYSKWIRRKTFGACATTKRGKFGA